MATYEHVTVALPVELAGRLKQGVARLGISKRQLLIRAIDRELGVLEEKASEDAVMRSFEAQNAALREYES